MSFLLYDLRDYILFFRSNHSLGSPEFCNNRRHSLCQQARCFQGLCVPLYHDYNSSYITVLGNSGAFTPNNGTWVTSLSSYGTQIATTQINVADTLSSTLAITKGGTGATTKLNAKTNLGISYGTALPTSGMSEGDIFFKLG